MSPLLQNTLHVLVVALVVHLLTRRAYRQGYAAGRQASQHPLARLLSQMQPHHEPLQLPQPGIWHTNHRLDWLPGALLVALRDAWRSKWVRPLVSAALVLGLAYQLQTTARPWVLAGTVAQQYDARLAMSCSWIMVGVGLALSQPAVWHKGTTRRLSWGMVALGALFIMLSWFNSRHQFAVQLAPGVYQIHPH